MAFGVLANAISRTGGQPIFPFPNCNKGLETATFQPFMKFGSIAILALTLAVLRPSPAAENCPLDHAFMSGIKAGTINPNRMESIAGLAASRTPGFLYAHNSGAINRIFLLETGSRSVADFTLDRTLTDAQDIAVGSSLAGTPVIFLADIGGMRSSVVIAEFAEPSLTPLPSGILPAPAQTYYTLNYPDGPHDARAFFTDASIREFYVVTYEESQARIYRMPQSALSGSLPMELIATLPIGRVTAADMRFTKIILRNVSSGLMWTMRHGRSIAQSLEFPPHPVPILDGFENNGNALAVAQDESGYYTTGQGPDPALYFFARNTSPFTTGTGLATISEPTVTEISGVAASHRNPGLLWMHNDGAPYYTYLVSTNGDVVATYQFATAIDDYEDIAVGPGPIAGTRYVYAGDIGDNLLIRGEVRVFRFPEPRVTQMIPGISNAGETVVTLLYPDGVHDAEALMIDPLTGDLFVVTKEANAFRVFKATQAQLNSGNAETLTLVQTGTFGPVSGGDISPDGSMIVLRHEREARLWRRRGGGSIETALSRASERIPVIGEPIEGNGEGITFALDLRGYYTMSEGILPTIYFFDHLAEPRFIGPPELTQNSVRLAVSGCDGSTIRLEGSNELTVWATVGSGYVEDGIATINSSGGAPLRFYRAVVDGP
jgi:hypothetical protein